MHVLIIGAAGMLGRKLTEQLAKEGRLGEHPIARMTLHEASSRHRPKRLHLRSRHSPPTSPPPGETEKLLTERPDVIFHLAAIVSAEAETDFDKGYRINLDGTRRLFEALRQVGEGYAPRLVFTSSIAVFGAPFPEAIGDEFLTAPLTSYGAQKAIGELLLSDYSRRGHLDGVGIRLPTICVRPGTPNKAASGFFSNIIREPLKGEEAVLPVSDDVMHWHASPRSAVGFLIHAGAMDTAQLGPRRVLNMPGVAATVAEQIETIRKVAGDNVVRRIRREPDPMIARIVADWPRRFDARRARELGFTAEGLVRGHYPHTYRG